MNEEVKTLIDEVFMRWSGHNPDLAEESAARFINEYSINESTTFEECKSKLQEFKKRMEALQRALKYGI